MSICVLPSSAPRCPFLAAVDAGRLEYAAHIAMSGPEPAEPAIVPVLLRWAAMFLDGEIDLAFLGLEGLHGAPASPHGPQPGGDR